MKTINSKLFKDNLYEITNIHTGDMVEIVLANNEEDALGNSANENLSACSFFENGDRTMQDLEQELKQGGIELKEVLKTTEDLFYDFFDKEDYEIKDLLHTHGSTQYVVIDKVQGHAVTFDISEDYNVFNVVASGTFFANTYTIKWWLDYLNSLEEIEWVIFDYKHPELDNE